ncbi:unnamed protein product, partial [Amoebophrya sp. A25]
VVVTGSSKAVSSTSNPSAAAASSTSSSSSGQAASSSSSAPNPRRDVPAWYRPNVKTSERLVLRSPLVKESEAFIYRDGRKVYLPNSEGAAVAWQVFEEDADEK